jgi:predicted O-methyltransferase YrrM
LKKQEALFKVGQKASHLLEIGVYLGHSLLILLVSNPTLRITCIDNDARYSPKAVEYLNQHFGNRITFHLGDASEVLKTLPSDEYDAIHIDADHTHEAVRSHFIHSLPLAKKNALIVFDDYEATQSLIDKFIADKVLTIVDLPRCLWTNIVTQLNV